MAGGNCKHDVLVQCQFEKRTVVVCNDADDHYFQRFEKPEELDAFVAELLKARVEAWGKVTAEEAGLAE